MDKESFEQVSARMTAHWNNLEKLSRLHLTLHDYSGFIKVSPEDNLMEGINYHRTACCKFHGNTHKSCIAHCAIGAKLRAAEEKGAFTMSCWAGVKELVVPLYLGNDLAATVFAGVFRDGEFDVSSMPRGYRKLYKALPLWDESRKEELESVLVAAGYAMLKIAENFRTSTEYDSAGRESMIRKFFLFRFSEDVGAGDLAETLGLSESRTLHLLRAHFGKGFSQLLNEERLLHVTEYLTQTRLPLREIAKLTGFRNEYYLNTVFKKFRGITPGAFRKEENS